MEYLGNGCSDDCSDVYCKPGVDGHLMIWSTNYNGFLSPGEWSGLFSWKLRRSVADSLETPCRSVIPVPFDQFLDEIVDK